MSKPGISLSGHENFNWPTDYADNREEDDRMTQYRKKHATKYSSGAIQ